MGRLITKSAPRILLSFSGFLNPSSHSATINRAMPHSGDRASSSHSAFEAERYPDFRRRSGHGNKERAKEAAENRAEWVHGDIRGHGKGGGDIAGRKR